MRDAFPSRGNGVYKEIILYKDDKWKEGAYAAEKGIFGMALCHAFGK